MKQDGDSEDKPSPTITSSTSSSTTSQLSSWCPSSPSANVNTISSLPATVSSSSSSSLLQSNNTNDHLWKPCISKFESFRESQTPHISIRNIFFLINARGTKSLPKREFIDNLLSMIHTISRPEAIAFAEHIDKRHTNIITFSDLYNVIIQQAKDIKDSKLLHINCEHPIFSDWLTARQDFRNFWYETTKSGGTNNIDNIERILEIDGDDRTTLDLQTLMRFIKDNKLLTNVKENRLLDICRVFRPMKCPNGTKVVCQGDPGDAFYIILHGTFVIDIDGKIVNTLGSGNAFGEKALENDAPRGASVISTTISSSLMVLLAFDYKCMVATAQAKQNQEITTFLHESCYAMNYLSHAKIAHIVRLASRQRYNEGEIIMRQNDVPTGLLVIESGTICITRNMIITQESESFLPSVLSITSCNSFRPSIATSAASRENAHGSGYRSIDSIQKKEIAIAYLHKGDVFGDDICRKKNLKNTYGAYATSVVDIIIINPSVAHLYFDKGRTLELLMTTTYRLHRPDEEYIEEYQTNARKSKILSKIKEDALQNSANYRQRLNMKKKITRSSSSSSSSSSYDTYAGYLSSMSNKKLSHSSSSSSSSSTSILRSLHKKGQQPLIAKSHSLPTLQNANNFTNNSEDNNIKIRIDAEINTSCMDNSNVEKHSLESPHDGDDNLQDRINPPENIVTESHVQLPLSQAERDMSSIELETVTKVSTSDQMVRSILKDNTKQEVKTSLSSSSSSSSSPSMATNCGVTKKVQFLESSLVTSSARSRIRGGSTHRQRHD